MVGDQNLLTLPHAPSPRTTSFLFSCLGWERREGRRNGVLYPWTKERGGSMPESLPDMFKATTHRDDQSFDADNFHPTFAPQLTNLLFPTLEGPPNTL